MYYLQLFEMLDPRLIVSAHTHHGCFRIHDNNVPEYTVASYNWRNKHTPTFLLVSVIISCVSTLVWYITSLFFIFDVFFISNFQSSP